MPEILFAWVGRTDIRASEGDLPSGVGPVAQATAAFEFDQLVLLSNYGRSETQRYIKWLRGKTNAGISVTHVELTSPMDFEEIYRASVASVSEPVKHSPDAELTFHLSPGTSAMAAVWIILSKTRFPARLIESSREKGVQVAAFPFDISAEFLPDLLRKPDATLRALSAGDVPEGAAFGDIVYRCLAMRETVALARKIAIRNVPVLLEGESGTGKELFARAIHAESPRREKRLVAVNCGAIPKDLIEAQLFGHVKGAFTGATSDRSGYFHEADGSTLFLDEIGELPLEAQVKLLRVLQTQEVARIGETRPRKVDVRIVAATNRDLVDEVSNGGFREDLYYRIAVAVLRIPPLREREGDLGLLAQHLLKNINDVEAQVEPGYVRKKLSPAAKTALQAHGWPGNVRELHNTLHRAAVWAESETIGRQEVDAALLRRAPREASTAPPLLGDGFSLLQYIDCLAKKCIEQALQTSGGNKSQAAKLLGLASHQTLTNWMKRLGVR